MSQHLRFETTNGPVHVYVPDGYSGGGTVIYVHGYNDTVDSAWTKQQLQTQWDASARDAIFVAVEAPQARGDSVKWRDLGALLDAVAINLGISLADPVVAIGHSDGYETIVNWLSNPRLTHVILLDALYGYVSQYLNWANQPGHTLTLLVTKSGSPRTNSESILGKLSGLVQKVGTGVVTATEQAAKTLYVLASQSHMQLVEPQPGPATSWVIPTLLRRSPIPAIGGLPGLIFAAGIGFLLYALWRKGA